MDRSPLQIIQEQTLIAKQAIQSRDGKVTKMLVINSIEFAVRNEIEEIGYLDHEDPVLLEKKRNASNETPKIRNVCQDIVGEKDICPLPFLKQRLCQL